MNALRAGRVAEKVAYRVAGLPIAVRARLENNPGDPLRAVFAQSYWHPRSASEASELALALILWPLVVLLGSAWYTWRNGSIVRARDGKSIASQFGEQIRLYFSAGVLAPWYYIFSLYEEAEHASDYIQRFESKSCYIPMLKSKKGSPLNNKVRFASYCTERQIRCVQTLLCLDGQPPSQPLPECDLFVKPAAGRGGRGAERWDLVAPGLFANPEGGQLESQTLLDRLFAQSRRRALIVQPRLQPHGELSHITAGALPTVRVLTTLNEHDEPEIIAAVFRTSVGRNRTVDNLHAGGIAALVDLDSGQLSKASDLGADVRLGWLTAHPDSGAQLEGAVLPYWSDVKELAISAHCKFADRTVIGWDVAIVSDGAILVEGNGNPDLDIVQRFMRAGLREHRFARLIDRRLQRVGAQSQPKPTSAVCQDPVRTYATPSFARAAPPSRGSVKLLHGAFGQLLATLAVPGTAAVTLAFFLGHLPHLRAILFDGGAVLLAATLLAVAIEVRSAG